MGFKNKLSGADQRAAQDMRFRPRPVSPGTSSADKSAAKRMQARNGPKGVGGAAASKSSALTRGSRGAMREMARRKAATGGY